MEAIASIHLCSTALAIELFLRVLDACSNMIKQLEEYIRTKIYQDLEKEQCKGI